MKAGLDGRPCHCWNRLPGRHAALGVFRACGAHRLDCVNHTPRLSRWFESCLPGFILSALLRHNNFGPMMRFAYGAGFASRHLSEHLVRTLPYKRQALRDHGEHATDKVSLASI